MRHSRDDVIARAVQVLDTWGLADLTMRRLAAELDVQPSALYHHVPSKQVLLAAVADEILRRAGAPAPAHTWPERVHGAATWLRDGVLAYRDGAEVVSTALTLGLGGQSARVAVASALADTGLDDADQQAAAQVLLHFVLGHAGACQLRLQAESAGALDGPQRDHRTAAGLDEAEFSRFSRGLALLVAGIAEQAEGATDAPRERVHP